MWIVAVSVSPFPKKYVASDGTLVAAAAAEAIWIADNDVVSANHAVEGLAEGLL